MKKVYVSFLLHGNMCYDRYTKQEIREKFPVIYAAGVRAMQRFPQVTAHIDFPGLTVLSLEHHASWFLEELKPLIARGQVVMLGCQYAASHAMCSDEESDLLAGRLSMEIIRDELQPDVAAYFNQEIPFHPQTPYILNQIGARRLVLRQLEGWKRPRRVRGLDGSEIILYPLDITHGQVEALEALYDAHDDGDFVMTGGDFEMLVNVETVVEKIAELARKGKVIEWMTVDRYEREVGVRDVWDCPRVYGTAVEDRPESPSFSRWVADPEDVIWHGRALGAMEGLRTAGFAAVAAAIHGLGEVDVPLAQSWTTPPDNPWDAWFEEVNEYPETEACYLSRTGTPTLLSRAWHHLLIGINSDASGWFPWQPRTRHRNTSSVAARALADEVVTRFAHVLAARLAPPPTATGCVLALNPAPARAVELTLRTEAPLAFITPDSEPIATAVSLVDGQWQARARLRLPAYGYRLFGLVQAAPTAPVLWSAGSEARCGERFARLSQGTLIIGEREHCVAVSVAPFRLSDPSGVAATEDVVPNWQRAVTRVRATVLGADLEVFTELAWTVWLRLVIGLREDRIELDAEVHVDLPRRIGPLRYEPNGLLLQFTGAPGPVYYDIPYATIQHPSAARSFVAAQRFVALDAGPASFGLVALEGNQSYMLAAREGILAANLGASTQGRPDTRPECVLFPDGTAEHRITSGGDPFYGSYTHRFALVFGDRAAVAGAAHRLRRPVPMVRVTPGGGDWPPERSLLEIAPASARVTAFRLTRNGYEIVLNDLSGAPSHVSLKGVNELTADLMPYGIVTLGERLGAR